MIETIVNGDNNIMWVLTNHGLNLVDTESRTITTYSWFGGQELMAIDDDGTLFIMTEDSKIHLHRRKADGDFLIGGQSAIPFNKTKASESVATISSSSLPTAYTISRSNTIPRVKPSKSGKQAGISTSR